jgi:hypothetical protein
MRQLDESYQLCFSNSRYFQNNFNDTNKLYIDILKVFLKN